jgi:hypothetical protein
LGRRDRDPLAAEFGHERFSVRWISKAKADVIGYRLAAQIGARLVRYRAGVTELVHCHQSRDEAATGNQDRDLVGRVAIDSTLGDFAFALGHAFLSFVLRSAVANGGALLIAYLTGISICPVYGPGSAG